MRGTTRIAGCAALIAAVCVGVMSAEFDSVYELADGMVVFEPENMSYSTAHWSKRTSPSGYRGSGWLYVSDGGRTGDDCHNVATVQDCLGPESSWISVPVHLPEPQGEFGAIMCMDVRAYRDHSGDGGNDIWVGVRNVDARLPNETGIAFRIGCSTEGYNYCWGTVTPDRLPGQGGWAYWSIREPGVYEFFIAGRSDTFGVDRVIVYQAAKTTSAPGLGDLHFPDVWNPNAPVTQMVPYSTAVTGSGGIETPRHPTLRLLPTGLVMLDGLQVDDKVTATDLTGKRLVVRRDGAGLSMSQEVASGMVLLRVLRDGTAVSTHRIGTGF